MYKLGLIGDPLSHSFSKKYFDLKFKNQKIKNFSYSLYPITDINKIDDLVFKHKIIGLNVTSPYKTEIIKYLDELEETARKINCVNTVFVNLKTKKKYGFNTDLIGFEKTLEAVELTKNKKALILGAGSVSKTISYCLEKHQIEHLIVSRKPTKNMINYSSISNFISRFKIIINTTPLGQYPNKTKFPKIPYKLLSNEHHCIDLIYNPPKTIFLQNCSNNGAKIINGERMLSEQANASWKIWMELIFRHNV